MTGAEADELAAVVIGAFPAARVTEATPRVYSAALRDLPHELADRAVKRLLVSAKFMPTIAEIREAAVELANGPQRAGAEAWGDVLRAVGRLGIDRPPHAFKPLPALDGVELLDGLAPCVSCAALKSAPQHTPFADPLVAIAVDAVGWRAICNSDETDPAPRAKFADAYNAAARRERVTAAGSAGAVNPKLAHRSNASLPIADLVKQIADHAEGESDDAE